MLNEIALTATKIMVYNCLAKFQSQMKFIFKKWEQEQVHFLCGFKD